MPLLNSAMGKKLSTFLQSLYHGLRSIGIILGVTVAIYIFVIKCFGLQDIYWNQISPIPNNDPSLDSIQYRLINNSFFSSQPMCFTFTVDVNEKGILCLKDTPDPLLYLKDPNNLLLVELCDSELKDKQKDCNRTKVTISYTNCLGPSKDTLIKLYWIKSNCFVPDKPEWSSDRVGSGNYKIYPRESERRTLVQFIWQVILFFIFAMVVGMFALLLRARKRFKSQSEELAITKNALKREKSDSDTREQLNRLLADTSEVKAWVNDQKNKQYPARQELHPQEDKSEQQIEKAINSAPTKKKSKKHRESDTI
jgi:hypothetical protein